MTIVRVKSTSSVHTLEKEEVLPLASWCEMEVVVQCSGRHSGSNLPYPLISPNILHMVVMPHDAVAGASR